jgi:hypothetical protein
VAASVQNRRVTRYPVIRLAKLALWALQDDRVASAWHLWDNHVCGAVAISAGEKKTKKSKKWGATATLPPFQARASSRGIQTNVFTKFPAEIGKIGEKVGVGPGVGGTKQWTEFVKESSADTAWSGWILFVEFGNSLFSVCQVLGGFPGIFAFAVALPADKVLKLTAVNTTVDDRIDFVFFFALNDYRFRQGRLMKTVVVPWTEAADMEDEIQV